MAVDATVSQMGKIRENTSHLPVADFLHLNHRAITIIHSPLLSEVVLTFEEDPEDIWVFVDLTTVGFRSIRLVPSLPALHISLGFEFIFPLFFIFNSWESNINVQYMCVCVCVCVCVYIYEQRLIIMQFNQKQFTVLEPLSHFILYNSRHHKSIKTARRPRKCK